MYYQNNLDSTIVLCKVMNEFNCKRIVFSSSATVYGDPASLPIKEDFPLSTTNPYGTTKLFIERILTDLQYADCLLYTSVHMGPRVGANSVESGYKRGYHFGLIASGDNHSVPAVSEFGSMAVLAENRTKDAIWDAMQKRHVYGVSNELIKLRMDLDGAMMGDCTSFKEASKLNLNIDCLLYTSRCV